MGGKTSTTHDPPLPPLESLRALDPICSSGGEGFGACILQAQNRYRINHYCGYALQLDASAFARAKLFRQSKVYKSSRSLALSTKPMQCALTIDGVRYRRGSYWIMPSSSTQPRHERACSVPNSGTTPETVFITWEPNQGTYHADAASLHGPWTQGNCQLIDHRLVLREATVE
jgi:hypothetical protein